MNRHRTWIVLGAVALVIAIAVGVAVAASGGGSSGSNGAGGSTASGSSGSTAGMLHEVGPVTVSGTRLPSFTDPNHDTAIGRPIPTLTGETFDGTPMTIAPNGKPQVVLFVAHWCPHCQAEVPRLVELASSGAFNGIDVATVATGTNADYPNYPPSSWLQREHWPFPVMVDSEQQTAAIAYGLPAYPYFVFVDANGNVAGRATGEIAPDSLTKILDALAAGKALPTVSGASSSAK